MVSGWWATLPRGQTFHHYVTFYRFIGNAIMSRVRRFLPLTWRSPIQVTRKKWKWISCFIISAFRGSDRRLTYVGESENSFLFAFVRGARRREKSFLSSFSRLFDRTNFFRFDFHSVPASASSQSKFKIFRDISIGACARHTKSSRLNTNPAVCWLVAEIDKGPDETNDRNFFSMLRRKRESSSASRRSSFNRWFMLGKFPPITCQFNLMWNKKPKERIASVESCTIVSDVLRFSCGAWW